MLNKNPDRRPGISQIIQTKLIQKYTKALINYGRAIKLQVDDLKKGFEEIAGEEAKEAEENKAKQLDVSIKGDPSISSKVIAKDEKKVNTLSEMKKQKKEEEEKKPNKNA